MEPSEGDATENRSLRGTAYEHIGSIMLQRFSGHTDKKNTLAHIKIQLQFLFLVHKYSDAAILFCLHHG